MKKIKNKLEKWATYIIRLYFIFLFGWLFANTIFGDHIGVVGVVASLAFYLFIPLPFAAIVALVTRKRDLIGGIALGIFTFLCFWGTLLIPRSIQTKNNNSEFTLTVMTYNVLGEHDFTAPVLKVIREANADIVCLQEVTPVLAKALQTELIEEYPYQILDPQNSVEGMGSISRFPIRLNGEQLSMGWVGVPQIIEMDFHGLPVTVVNFHTYPYRFDSLEVFRDLNRKRLAQAAILAEFANSSRNPLVIAGDANTSPLNETYRIILQSPLKDVWQEAGFGLGHTFPGSALPGSSRPKIGEWYIPKWLTRIDYIFYSPHWDVVSAEIAPFDGVSDHRGVIARLSERSEK